MKTKTKRGAAARCGDLTGIFAAFYGSVGSGQTCVVIAQVRELYPICDHAYDWEPLLAFRESDGALRTVSVALLPNEGLEDGRGLGDEGRARLVRFAATTRSSRRTGCCRQAADGASTISKASRKALGDRSLGVAKLAMSRCASWWNNRYGRGRLTRRSIPLEGRKQ